ncbi:MAG: GGDEF domain-containing protein [Gammaproteobacteria bacterium]|nr:MAG: GGDEF domain-containing protein [Gammaproteobacteria bacterium]
MVQVLVFNKDDEQKIKINRYFSSNGKGLYQLKFAESFRMEIFDNHYFDLIIVNQSGAGKVGLSFIEKINSLQIPIPVIFIMRGNSLSVDNHAMELGASDCLSMESLTQDSLQRSVRHVLIRRNTEAKLSFLATHDPLTGLSNRYLFQEHLVRSISVSKRKGTSFGLLLLDLDRFKMVNDSLGHDIGDLLLKEVALRIKSAVRAVDLVARFGGDEFTVLLDDINDIDELSKIAGKIQKALLPVMNLQGQEVFVTTSIGISHFPECGIVPLTLIKSADIAMYKAKELGRNTYHVYSNDLSEESRLKLVLERDLRRALIKGEFELFYQPQIDVKTNRIAGAEALLRWRHQTLGIIAPDKFIPLLEEMGMMIGVEQWVLRQVCNIAKMVNSPDFDRRNSDRTTIDNDSADEIKFSINISGSHFKLGDLAKNVEYAIRDSGVKASCIEIELTEDIMIEHVERNNEVLNSLSKMGVSIALDDFGKGYSSLTYLKDFPADILKIDKAFIDNLAVESRDSAIVSSMIELSHKLSIKVVAEGVEQPEQAEILRKQGCDYIQGYLFAKPMAVDQFLDFLQTDEKLNPSQLRTSQLKTSLSSVRT